MTKIEKLQELNSILHNGKGYKDSMFPAVVNNCSVYLIDLISISVMRDLVEELIKEELDGRSK